MQKNVLNSLSFAHPYPSPFFVFFRFHILQEPDSLTPLSNKINYDCVNNSLDYFLKHFRDDNK